MNADEFIDEPSDESGADESDADGSGSDGYRSYDSDEITDHYGEVLPDEYRDDVVGWTNLRRKRNDSIFDLAFSLRDPGRRRHLVATKVAQSVLLEESPTCRLLKAIHDCNLLIVKKSIEDGARLSDNEFNALDYALNESEFTESTKFEFTEICKILIWYNKK